MKGTRGARWLMVLCALAWGSVVGGCGRGCSSSGPRVGGTAAPSAVGAGANGDEPGRPARPPTIEQRITTLLDSYFVAMQRGDLDRMRGLMGGEMAQQFDAALKARGVEAMRLLVQTALPLRASGLPRPLREGVWVVGCAPASKSRSAPGRAAPQAMEAEVHLDGTSLLLYRLAGAHGGASAR